MKFFIKERNQGKTVKLIVTSEITGYPILVENEKRKNNIIITAKELGCNIPDPITYRHYVRFPDGLPKEKILIDDAELIIKYALESHLRAEVVAVTLTDQKNFK